MVLTLLGFVLLVCAEMLPFRVGIVCWCTNLNGYVVFGLYSNYSFAGLRLSPVFLHFGPECGSEMQQIEQFWSWMTAFVSLFLPFTVDSLCTVKPGIGKKKKKKKKQGGRWLFLEQVQEKTVTMFGVFRVQAKTCHHVQQYSHTDMVPLLLSRSPHRKYV